MTRRIGLGIIGLTVCAAVFGPWLVPHDPDVQSLAQRLAGPSWTHPLGLDELGRDILARLVSGARISLGVGLTVVSVSACVGILVGAVAGYAGGIVDTVIGRVMDVLLAFPGILLAIALVAVLGPSLTNVVLALVLYVVLDFDRPKRGMILIDQMPLIELQASLEHTKTD